MIVGKVSYSFNKFVVVVFDIIVYIILKIDCNVFMRLLNMMKL